MWKHQRIQQQQALTWCCHGPRQETVLIHLMWTKVAYPHISTPLINITSYLPFSYITKLPLSITKGRQKSPLGLNLFEMPWDALRNSYCNYEIGGVSSLSVVLL